MNSYDAARLASLPGAEVTVYFDPTKLSTHMRNKVRRMLKNGRLEGGYGSKARKIAGVLCKVYKVEALASFDNGYVRVRVGRAALKQEAEALTTAAKADARLAQAGKKEHWQGQFSQELSRFRVDDYGDDGFHAVLLPAQATMMRDVWDKWFVDQTHLHEKLDAVVYALDGDEPILLTPDAVDDAF